MVLLQLPLGHEVHVTVAISNTHRIPNSNRPKLLQLFWIEIAVQSDFVAVAHHQPELIDFDAEVYALQFFVHHLVFKVEYLQALLIESKKVLSVEQFDDVGLH